MGSNSFLFRTSIVRDLLFVVSHDFKVFYVCKRLRRKGNFVNKFKMDMSDNILQFVLELLTRKFLFDILNVLIHTALYLYTVLL